MDKASTGSASISVFVHLQLTELLVKPKMSRLQIC